MTRKSITINYKHIRKPYLTLEQRYRNKRKLKKLINRWKPIAIIAFMALIIGIAGILVNLPEKRVSGEETERIESNILYGIAPLETIIVPKEKIIQKNHSITAPPKKTIAREAKKDYKGSCFDYVNEMASRYKVDGEVMRRIIMAESGGNPNAKNKNSTASGCSQFIKATWEGTLRQMGREYISPFDPEANVEAMAFKISRGGIRAWDASKSKWSK